jgi:hypothetical protein
MMARDLYHILVQLHELGCLELTKQQQCRYKIMHAMRYGTVAELKKVLKEEPAEVVTKVVAGYYEYNDRFPFFWSCLEGRRDRRWTDQLDALLHAGANPMLLHRSWNSSFLHYMCQPRVTAEEDRNWIEEQANSVEVGSAEEEDESEAPSDDEAEEEELEDSNDSVASETESQSRSSGMARIEDEGELILATRIILYHLARYIGYQDIPASLPNIPNKARRGNQLTEKEFFMELPLPPRGIADILAPTTDLLRSTRRAEVNAFFDVQTASTPKRRQTDRSQPFNRTALVQAASDDRIFLVDLLCHYTDATLRDNVNRSWATELWAHKHHTTMSVVEDKEFEPYSSDGQFQWDKPRVREHIIHVEPRPMEEVPYTCEMIQKVCEKHRLRVSSVLDLLEPAFARLFWHCRSCLKRWQNEFSAIVASESLNSHHRRTTFKMFKDVNEWRGQFPSKHRRPLPTTAQVPLPNDLSDLLIEYPPMKRGHVVSDPFEEMLEDAREEASDEDEGETEGEGSTHDVHPTALPQPRP